MKQHLQNHRTAVTTTPPIGRLYNVGGRRLFLHRSGSKGPVVVFLAGPSAVGLDYPNVHDEVAEFTTWVLYDRGGTGWSGPVELPHTAANVASELRELLRARGPGPHRHDRRVMARQRAARCQTQSLSRNAFGVGPHVRRHTRVWTASRCVRPSCRRVTRRRAHRRYVRRRRWNPRPGSSIATPAGAWTPAIAGVSRARACT